MSNRQYVSPLVIQGRGADEKATKLQRIAHNEHGFDESWFQEKLFQHPDLLAAAEIEPAFNGLKAIAMELPIGANSADLLLVNSDGCIAIVETKLFRNPEAKREVIAQIIEYASELSGWTYEQFAEAIKRANNSTAEDALLEKARGLSEDPSIDEVRFKEQVTRNLQLGRLLLLIVGDEISEAVERMTEFIHRTPHLHFTLGLIEIALFKEVEDTTDRIIVQPRVIAQTQFGVRTLVEIKLPQGAQIRTEVAATEPAKPAGGSISEEQFYEQLGRISPPAAELVKWAVKEAKKHHLTVSWKAAMGPILWYRDERTGEDFNFGQLCKDGELNPTSWLPKFRRLGLPEDIAIGYLNDITNLVPGSSRRDDSWDGVTRTEFILDHEGSDEWLSLAKLYPHKEKWFEAIDRAIMRLQSLKGNAKQEP
jgi:hypothetical protein